jgi:ribonuclease BN (tRNA processing enzyme)
VGFDFVVLGSGVVVPQPGRASSCHLVQSDDCAILLDCGPVAALRCVEAGVSLQDLDAIAITHVHGDHCAGLVPVLDGMYAYPFFRRTQHISLAGPQELPGVLEHVGKAWPSIEEAKDAIVDLHTWDRGNLSCEPFVITPIPVTHLGHSVGLRIKGPGGVVGYTGDCNTREDIVHVAEDADVLVSECALPNGFDFPAHVSAEDIAYAVKETGVQKVVLVHIYPNVDLQEAQHTVEATGAEVIVASDLERIHVQGRREAYAQ